MRFPNGRYEAEGLYNSKGDPAGAAPILLSNRSADLLHLQPLEGINPGLQSDAQLLVLLRRLL